MRINLKEYKEFSKSDFLGDHLRLHIPRVIKNVDAGKGWAKISLDSLICSKESIDISLLMLGRSFTFGQEWTEMTLLLEFISPTAMRLRLDNGPDIKRKCQPMLVCEPENLTDYSMIETQDSFCFNTGEIKVILCKNPFHLKILDKNDKLIYSQYNDDLHNVTNDRRKGNKEGGDDGLEGERSRLSYTGFECFPFGCVIDEATGKSCFCESAETFYNESFYGFGERFGRLDKNGQEIYNWMINPIGVSSSKSYKNVPFFISSQGYGVYYNTPRKIRFSMNDYFYKAYSCQVEDDLLDMFIITGGDPGNILQGYTGLTGRSPVPPKWSFGVWMSRNCYRSRAEMEEVAHSLRERELPCDVIHLDWDYCKSDFDFEFDEARFPNMKEMTTKLEKEGFRFSIWQVPYLSENSDIYKYAAAHGYLAREEDGSPADKDAHMGVIDFSNPEAVEWYKGKLRALLEAGFRVIKTDFGENAQDCYHYQTVDGKDMHNLYPLLYNKAAYEVCQEVHRDDSMVWGRSAYAGCQRYPAYWGGDSDSDYKGIYHSLRGGLSLGLSGFPFWSHDVGGYFCTPDPDVYIRWLQFGMLSPLVRFHGVTAREPWAYGDEAVRQYKKYAALRYSLIEYIYSEAVKCAEDATPMLRALVVDFPGDLNVRNIDDQYMFGRNILVAPVLSANPSRMVYLPTGTSWLDLHTHTWHTGGKWIEAATPIDITPVFLKGGTATPFVEPMQHVCEKPYKKLRFEICPVDDISYYDLSTDAFNIRFRYDFTGKYGIGRITIDKPESAELEYHVNCPDVRELYVNGERLELIHEENGFVTARDKK